MSGALVRCADGRLKRCADGRLKRCGPTMCCGVSSFSLVASGILSCGGAPDANGSFVLPMASGSGDDCTWGFDTPGGFRWLIISLTIGSLRWNVRCTTTDAAHFVFDSATEFVPCADMVAFGLTVPNVFTVCSGSLYGYSGSVSISKLS